MCVCFVSSEQNNARAINSRIFVLIIIIILCVCLRVMEQFSKQSDFLHFKFQQKE